jgi:hypothetical protein
MVYSELTDEDLRELSAGVKRVYRLMRDGRWHRADDIRLAAGTGGIPASEGLRRMRELRKHGYEIERQRLQYARTWVYRLVGGPASDSEQLTLPLVSQTAAMVEGLEPGEPCGHPGCLSHVTHPCEGCGRIGGRQGGDDGE